MKTENTIINDAQKNKMQYHQVSEVHAKALLNNGKKVFGYVNCEIVEFSTLDQSELFYID